MRRSGILGRQADNFVTKFRLLKLKMFSFPKYFCSRIGMCVIKMYTVSGNRSKSSRFPESHWVVRCMVMLFTRLRFWCGNILNIHLCHASRRHNHPKLGIIEILQSANSKDVGRSHERKITFAKFSYLDYIGLYEIQRVILLKYPQNHTGRLTKE